PARRGRAGVDHRPAVLPPTGTAALGLPGIPQPDAVCRAAHCPADHPAAEHATELPLGAGDCPGAGVSQPCRALPWRLAALADRPVAVDHPGRGGLAGPPLEDTRHAVAG